MNIIMAKVFALIVLSEFSAARMWLEEPWHADASAPQPFPSRISRMYPAQRAAVVAAAKDAEPLSAAATPVLLARLNASSFRETLRRCCTSLAERPAAELLGLLRDIFSSSELLHNFDGSWETDATIEIGAYNATEYFPATWQLRYLQYFGPRFNRRFGFPASPEGISEESIFRLPKLHGPYDEPLTYIASACLVLEPNPAPSPCRPSRLFPTLRACTPKVGAHAHLFTGRHPACCTSL